MSGRELEFDFGPCAVPDDLLRRAAVHVSDRIAAPHPDRTVAELAADPNIRSDMRDLLNALGLTKEQP